MIARHFDDALRPHGLRSTQFNLMAVLAQRGPTSLSVLADAMAMERSGLSRTLKPLEQQGLVAIKTGDDKRMRHAVVTSQGMRKLKHVLPVWSDAQNQLETLIGRTDAKQFAQVNSTVSRRLTPDEG